MLAKSTQLRQLGLLVKTRTLAHNGRPAVPGLELVRGAKGKELDFTVRDISAELKHKENMKKRLHRCGIGLEARDKYERRCTLAERNDEVFKKEIIVEDKRKDSKACDRSFSDEYKFVFRRKVYSIFSAQVITDFEREMSVILQ